MITKSSGVQEGAKNVKNTKARWQNISFSGYASAKNGCLIREKMIMTGIKRCNNLSCQLIALSWGSPSSSESFESAKDSKVIPSKYAMIHSEIAKS